MDVDIMPFTVETANKAAKSIDTQIIIPTFQPQKIYIDIIKFEMVDLDVYTEPVDY